MHLVYYHYQSQLPISTWYPLPPFFFIHILVELPSYINAKEHKHLQHKPCTEKYRHAQKTYVDCMIWCEGYLIVISNMSDDHMDLSCRLALPFCVGPMYSTANLLIAIV